MQKRIIWGTFNDTIRSRWVQWQIFLRFVGLIGPDTQQTALTFAKDNWLFNSFCQEVMDLIWMPKKVHCLQLCVCYTHFRWWMSVVHICSPLFSAISGVYCVVIDLLCVVEYPLPPLTYWRSILMIKLQCFPWMIWPTTLLWLHDVSWRILQLCKKKTDSRFKIIVIDHTAVMLSVAVHITATHAHHWLSHLGPVPGRAC